MWELNLSGQGVRPAPALQGARRSLLPYRDRGEPKKLQSYDDTGLLRKDGLDVDEVKISGRRGALGLLSVEYRMSAWVWVTGASCRQTARL